MGEVSIMGKGDDTKRKYVEITSQFIKEEGLEEVSIRKIAHRVGCDPAVLYRHFTNLDFLIVLAAMNLFDDYFLKLLDIEKHQGTGIETAIESWDAFITSAYECPQLYYRVFCVCEPHVFHDAIKVYFKLFPVKEELQEINDYGVFFLSLYSENAYTRSLYYFRRAANEGAISFGDSRYLSHVIPSIYSYQLNQHQKGFVDEDEHDRELEHCIKLIHHTIFLCLTEKGREQLNEEQRKEFEQDH